MPGKTRKHKLRGGVPLPLPKGYENWTTKQFCDWFRRNPHTGDLGVIHRRETLLRAAMQKIGSEPEKIVERSYVRKCFVGNQGEEMLKLSPGYQKRLAEAEQERKVAADQAERDRVIQLRKQGYDFFLKTTNPEEVARTERKETEQRQRDARETRQAQDAVGLRRLQADIDMERQLKAVPDPFVDAELIIHKNGKVEQTVPVTVRGREQEIFTLIRKRDGYDTYVRTLPRYDPDNGWELRYEDGSSVWLQVVPRGGRKTRKQRRKH